MAAWLVEFKGTQLWKEDPDTSILWEDRKNFVIVAKKRAAVLSRKCCFPVSICLSGYNVPIHGPEEKNKSYRRLKINKSSKLNEMVAFIHLLRNV